MELLPGTFPEEGHAACARGFAIGTLYHRLNMGAEEPRTSLAVTQPVFGIQVIAASGTDERTRSLWMIGIEPVTACEASVHLNVMVTVIDHVRGAAFVA